MPAAIRNLVPMVHVADVARSIAFYERFGFRVGNTFTPLDTSTLAWAWLENGAAQVMLTRASEPVVPERQAVLFYLYFDDVAATKALLTEAGVDTGPICYPFYAPRGEFRVTDPDGYCLMVMHT
jgi:predicted enzyme related to lactoylglutathione lyase